MLASAGPCGCLSSEVRSTGTHMFVANTKGANLPFKGKGNHTAPLRVVAVSRDHGNFHGEDEEGGSGWTGPGRASQDWSGILRDDSGANKAF